MAWITPQDVLNKRGEIIIIGDRGPVTINPRVMMEKNASVKGLMYTNQTVRDSDDFSHDLAKTA